MKKLQFIASCPQHGVLDHPPNECHITQEYVAALLFKQLGNYGFDAQHIVHEHEKVEVLIITFYHCLLLASKPTMRGI